MLISINGTKIEVEDNITVKSCIVSRKLNPDTVVVEMNRAVLPRDEWDKTVLKENDSMEILSFVGGG